MSIKFILSTIIFFTFFVPFQALSATYYVSTTGDNADAGTIGEPWLTLQYAANTISSGDTVIIRGGTYSAGFTINNKSNVTFEAYPTETPIIDGGGPGTGNDLTYNNNLVLIQSDDFTLDGVTVRDSVGKGIGIYGNVYSSDNCTIKNCSILNNFMQGLAGGYHSGLIVEDCLFEDNCVQNLVGWDPPGTSVGACTLVVQFAQFAIVRRNTIRNNYFEGLGLYRQSYQCLAENNEIYGNERTQVYLSNGGENTVRNNLIYGTNPNGNGRNGTGPGIWFTNEKESSNPDFDCGHIIYGNLIAGTSTNLWIAGLLNYPCRDCSIYANTLVGGINYDVLGQAGTGTGHLVENNIIITTNGIAASVPSQVTFAYNAWSVSQATLDNDAEGTGSVYSANIDLSKESGWNSLVGGDLDGTEFEIVSGESIDAGLSVEGYNDRITDCDFTASPKTVTTVDDSDNPDMGAFGNAIGEATGTAVAYPGYIPEAGIVTGGYTIVVTVSNTELVATLGEDNAITDALIAGLVSDGAQTHGFANEVSIAYTDFVRNSAVYFTLTLPVSAGYDIENNEHWTWTLPGTATTSGSPIVVTPTILISADVDEPETPPSGGTGDGKVGFYSSNGLTTIPGNVSVFAP